MGTWAFGHLRHSGTRALRALWYLGIWALRVLRHLGTRALKELGLSSTWVLEALYLADSSFHDSPQKNVNQRNQNVILKRHTNQEYDSQSQNHVVNIQYQKVSKQQSRNQYQKSKQEKRLYIGNFKKDLKEKILFGFNATTYLHVNCRVQLPTGKMGKIKANFAVMSEHVQKEELLKLQGIELK